MKPHFWLELAWVFCDEFFLGKIQISDFVEGMTTYFDTYRQVE
jgi:hypothetical protein